MKLGETPVKTPNFTTQIKEKQKQPKQDLPVYIREAAENDIAFIFSSWLKSARQVSFAQKTDNAVYFTEHHKLIEKLLKRCTVHVATDVNDINNIFGYMVHERIDGLFTCHYAYVKHDFRNLGIFKELLKTAGHDGSSAGLFTHDTISALKISPKFNLVYHPYLLINY